ncbi:uncharacterized protein RJT20DRAFT_36625 [Scheffersomyces xylosifermentans]|uniref:uncharacterized protein n=1 Tax=Scheffersomyces xylosifermentans TaxID=1304137 RepID=UPI00315DBDEE
MTTLVQQHSHQSYDSPSDFASSVNVDKVVQSVTNATKRLSQISTNTTNSNKKRRSQNKIGPWKLGRTLGRGSTGRVRLAKNINTGKLAAVKIVPKSNFKKLENPKYKRSSVPGKDSLPYGIEREIIIMKLMSHPNIMGLYDVWENKNDLYLILEYIEGGELFDYLIKRGKLQEFEAINYFKQIIHGIGYLHQFNICHRDLKPENLLLDFNKNIKIADFGMAALEVREKLLETSCGSPHYASPEIVAGKNYHGAPSDIWSCGIILFALLTGHLPFDDENIRKLLLKVQNGKFIMPHELSWEAKDLITRMLRVNPDERITIDQILTHPLLTKYPEPTIAGGSSLASSTQNINVKPIESLEKIDKEILKNLSVLFHNCDEKTIISKLLSPNKCPEKMFYYLLMKYRNEHTSGNAISSNDDDVDYADARQIPRSTSIVKTTIVDQKTGEKHVTVKRIPNSTSIHSARSTSKSINSKVLGNITNTPTNSIKNFKASNSFNKKKTIMSKQVMSRTNMVAGSNVRKGTPPTSSNNLSRTIVASHSNRKTAKKPESSPPQQEPPKMTRRLTGLDLTDFEVLADDDKSSKKSREDDGSNTSNEVDNTESNKENRNISASSIKNLNFNKANSHLLKKKEFVSNKTLLNFELMCDEALSGDDKLSLDPPVKSLPEKVPKRSKESLMSRKERELANKVHQLNEEQERRLKQREEEAEAMLAKEKEAQAEQERKRQSLLLYEKQREAIEKLKKHQSSNDFGNLISQPTRLATEPARSSLDPRITSLFRARSLASPSSYASSRFALSSANNTSNNTTKVLHKLGIDVAPSPRKLDSSLKTSSSKNLAGYLSSSTVHDDDDVAESIAEEEEEDDNKENEVAVSLEQFNKRERAVSGILKPSTSNSTSLTTSSVLTNSTTNGSPSKRKSMQTTYYKSLLNDIDETKATKKEDDSTFKRESVLSRDENQISVLNSSISKAQLPNPHFSRFSFGALLGNASNNAYSASNDIGDMTILNNLQSTSGTVIKKNRNSLASDSSKRNSSGSMLRKSSTTNLLGLGINMKGQPQHASTKKKIQKSRVVSTASSKFSETLTANFISVNVSEDASTTGNSTLEKNAVSLMGFDSEYGDDENESDLTMLDDSASSNTSLRPRSTRKSQIPQRNNTFNFLETELSTFDVYSSRTADVGKLNSAKPSKVSSNNSKETLILDDEEDEAVKIDYPNYESLFNDSNRQSKRLSQLSKPELSSKETFPDDEIEDVDDNDSFAVADDNSGILDNDSLAETLDPDSKSATFDFDTSKHSDSFQKAAEKNVDEEDEDSGVLKRSRADTEIFSTMNMNKIRVTPSNHDELVTPAIPKQTIVISNKTLIIPTPRGSLEGDNSPIVTNSAMDSKRSSLLRKISMKPRREAPKPPPAEVEFATNRFSRSSLLSKTVKENNNRNKAAEPPRKSNWFKKIFQSLSSSPTTKSKIDFNGDEAISSKDITIIDSSLTSVELIRIIRTQLQLKKIEGTISKVDIDEEFGLITGVIPAKFAHGRKLKFKMEIIDLINTSSMHLIKIKGNEKGFSSLINIISFIIKQEEEATNKRRTGYQMSGFKKV